MIRPILTEIGIFLIPFAAYALFLIATRSGVLSPSSWPAHLIAKLVLASLLQEHSGDNRLEAIAHRYGMEVVGRHTALGDALITAEVFLKMLPQLEGRGIVTLGQALEASRRSKYAGLRY